MSLAPALCLLVLLSVVLQAAEAADVNLQTPPALQALQTVTFGWSYSTDQGLASVGSKGTLVLVKVNGDINQVTPVVTIASGINPADGSITYQVPGNLPKAFDYALQWQWDNQPTQAFRYSAPFAVGGGSSDGPKGTGTGSRTATSAAPSSSMTSDGSNGSKTTTSSGTSTSIPAASRTGMGMPPVTVTATPTGTSTSKSSSPPPPALVIGSGAAMARVPSVSAAAAVAILFIAAL
ncbi:hypothetical protein BC828DRAFT_409632 [Blastocladiella britannica]|nr:hypothetical protein BC828DRAFT_409632 [Blastocladiella britannica]